MEKTSTGETPVPPGQKKPSGALAPRPSLIHCEWIDGFRAATQNVYGKWLDAALKTPGGTGVPPVMEKASTGEAPVPPRQKKPRSNMTQLSWYYGGDE